MRIQELRLEGFRNYERLEVAFSPKSNVIVGDNAQGKTNVIEAISMLAFAKSHRATRDSEMIQWTHSFARIHGTIERAQRTVRLDLVLQERGKKASVNEIERRKMSEFIGVFNVVLFAPEHLDMIKRGPSERRKFVDMELGQINPSYLHHLSQYQKALLQRNKLLKQGSHAIDPIMLSVWDEQLSEHGAQVVRRRQQFVDRLQWFAERTHRKIAEHEDLRLSYKSTLDDRVAEDPADLQKRFLEKLMSSRHVDIARGATTVGPHRDDIEILINGRPAALYASQGQQRTAALSIKLAEIDLIHDHTNDLPVLLLDDVLSELDESRQIHLIQAMGERVQTIITTASTLGIDRFLSQETTMYHVQSGIMNPKRWD